MNRRRGVESFREKNPRIGTEILDWAWEMHPIGPISKYLVRFLANKQRVRKGRNRPPRLLTIQSLVSLALSHFSFPSRSQGQRRRLFFTTHRRYYTTTFASVLVHPSLTPRILSSSQSSSVSLPSRSLYCFILLYKLQSLYFWCGLLDCFALASSVHMLY